MKHQVEGLMIDLGLQHLVPRLRLHHPLWRVESAYDLIQLGVKMYSDYSLIKFTENEKLLLITNDRENQMGCEENQIPVMYLIPLSSEQQYQNLHSELAEKYQVYEPELVSTFNH